MTHHTDGAARPPATRAARGRGAGAPVAGAVVALAAAALLITGAIRPVLGRFGGSTDTTGSIMRTAVVDLDVGAGGDPSSGSLAIEADNLVPGDAVQRCIRVDYHGSADDVDVRLMGRSDGGSGLDAYLLARVEAGGGSDPACTDFEREAAVWEGPLDDLWATHGSFGDAVPILDAVDAGAAVTLRVTLQLLDDDRAQGRDTGFWFVVEARP